MLQPDINMDDIEVGIDHLLTTRKKGWKYKYKNIVSGQ